MKSAHTYQRIVAFIIDIIIINIVVSLLTSGIPESKNYVEAKESTNNLVEKYINGDIESREAIDSLYDNKYIMDKESIPNNLISLVITIGYFVVFGYYNKGQTFGKKLMHIRIVNNEGQDVNYIQLFGRSLIIHEAFLVITSMILIGLVSKNQYLHITGIIDIIQTIAVICSIIMIATRDDKRGLHDIVFKTKVIEC